MTLGMHEPRAHPRTMQCRVYFGASAGSDGYVREPVRSPACRAIHAATWARELKPSLVSMLATCRATVAWLMTSSSAMARLLSPRAISQAISSSRGVSVDASAPEAAVAAVSAPSRPAPGWPRRYPRTAAGPRS